MLYHAKTMGVENLNSMQQEIGPKALIASVENFGFASYERILFEGFDLNIKNGEVTAITGKSGSGKTVLLKILAGKEKQIEGRQFINPKVKTVYVPQEMDDIDLDKNTTIRQLFKDARGLTAIENRMSEYEELLQKGKYGERDIERYGEIMDEYQKLDGYNSDSEMERVLSGIGISQKATKNITLDTTLNEVSSGQLRKIVIAMALYSKAGLILLDEPTSHLDVKSVEWLADYLKKCESAVVIASNNIQFIDSCANQTVGLTDIGRVFVFEGGYSAFANKRDSILGAEQVEAAQVASKLDQLKKTDAMFRAKQAYKRSPFMAQVGRALETRMNRLEHEYDSLPGSKRVYREEKIKDLSFTQERRAGTSVISIDGVVKKYDDNIAVDLSKVNVISVQQGERWLFWGPNGSGKSTLVRMIADSIKGEGFLPDKGVIKVGVGIKLGYYTPEVPSDIAQGILVDVLTNSVDMQNKGKSASILRFFGFSNMAIHKQDTRTLSSGEKKRFALARIMINHPNFIILDEPTGDFMPDQIKDRLANALNNYDGTFILVSHDQDFIGRLKIDKELDMPEGKLVLRS